MNAHIKNGKKTETDTNESLISMGGLEEIVKERNRREKVQLQIAKLLEVKDDLERKRAFAGPQQVAPIVEQLQKVELQLVDLRIALESPDVAPSMSV